MAEYGGEAVHTPHFVTCGARVEYVEYGGVWAVNEEAPRAGGVETVESGTQRVPDPRLQVTEASPQQAAGCAPTREARCVSPAKVAPGRVASDETKTTTPDRLKAMRGPPLKLFRVSRGPRASGSSFRCVTRQRASLRDPRARRWAVRSGGVESVRRESDRRSHGPGDQGEPRRVRGQHGTARRVPISVAPRGLGSSRPPWVPLVPLTSGAGGTSSPPTGAGVISAGTEAMLVVERAGMNVCCPAP